MRTLVLYLMATAVAIFPVASASAEGRLVRPLPAAECRKMAETLSKLRGGMKLSVTDDGQPGEVAERIAVTGNGCRLSGAIPIAKLPTGFDIDPMLWDKPAFKGWTHAPWGGYDGTDGGGDGISRGSTVLLYKYGAAVPAQICANADDLEACEEKNWRKAIYSFEAVVFTLVDGKPITGADFGGSN